MTRPQYSNEEIMAKAKELASRMGSTNQIQFYKHAEAKISANQKVLQLIDQIKRYQKESVNLQHFQKHEAYKRNEEKLHQLQEELDAIPVVQEFKQSQGEANDFLQQITRLISRRVTGDQ
ncbi:RicAFT regulatory complex protein RicA family protein [Sporolactobacillus sp. THM19-2]|jgi:cell fate (sporulation/competence/biofilm development) regulator YmcA (YheA/YmcA/DUF963 family)|uniref:RicAFT regulatory complex protein RicA family protein n=1 Tax=Sporolactobacillus sp. THM19-2 TaxID=2511171 RepID=UPI0010217DA8|nr:YlbF family regulator [Sporolactobacillus sp. THM19-2]RYL92244.1 hypothetical protein EWH91_08435 [Sporolactobacillus sp. THM19-2]